MVQPTTEFILAPNSVRLVSHYNPQFLHCYYIFFQTWTNEFLQWNASEFGNENTIHFWPDEVWTPDISLLNK